MEHCDFRSSGSLRSTTRLVSRRCVRGADCGRVSMLVRCSLVGGEDDDREDHLDYLSDSDEYLNNDPDGRLDGAPKSFDERASIRRVPVVHGSTRRRVAAATCEQLVAVVEQSRHGARRSRKPGPTTGFGSRSDEVLVGTQRLPLADLRRRGCGRCWTVRPVWALERSRCGVQGEWRRADRRRRLRRQWWRERCSASASVPDDGNARIGRALLGYRSGHERLDDHLPSTYRRQVDHHQLSE